MSTVLLEPSGHAITLVSHGRRALLRGGWAGKFSTIAYLIIGAFSLERVLETEVQRW